MKGLLKRITETTEMLSKINFLKRRQSVSPRGSPLSPRPSPAFPLLGRAPFPDVLFPLLPEKFSPSQAPSRPDSSLARPPPAPGRRLGKETPRGGEGAASRRRGAGARPPSPQLQPGASLSLPPPPSPGAHGPRGPRGSPARPRGGRRRGRGAARAGGPGRGDPARAAPPAAPEAAARVPPAPPGRPPRRRKRRRLGSARVQFKLSPPPPPPLPPAGRRAPGPPSPPPTPVRGRPRRAAPRAGPAARPGGRAAPAACGAADPRRGGPKLRLTHGAAVDAPLLSSSGSRTDRHPLPLRDQPGSGAARGFSKAAYADSAA